MRINPDRVSQPGNVTLGLRANLGQFSLLVLVNAFVGAMVGLERTVIPLMAEREFGLASKSAALSFIISFGLVKAATNFFAGRFSDRVGRKSLLVTGWLAGLPVPILIIFAPTWSWIILANVLLGVNQGLCWSTTVVMKIDLVGPRRRGTAMGLNEFAGYVAMSLAALASGYIAAHFGLRPQPFYLGIVFALVGLGLSTFVVRETRHFALYEESSQPTPSSRNFSTWHIFAQASWRNRTLAICSQAGLVNNLNDGMAWGLLPVYFAHAGLDLRAIGTLAAVYPLTWGMAQLLTGALSDRLGRKWMIATGLWLQAAAIGLFALRYGFQLWFASAILLGLGTAMVYPTLLAAISDAASPSWRASAVGVYRFWRDAGYAIGAILSGLIADLLGVGAAIVVTGALTFISGLLVAGQMRETLPGR